MKNSISDRFRPLSGQNRCCADFLGSGGRSTVGNRLKLDSSENENKNTGEQAELCLATVESFDGSRGCTLLLAGEKVLSRHRELDIETRQASQPVFDLYLSYTHHRKHPVD